MFINNFIFVSFEKKRRSFLFLNAIFHVGTFFMQRNRIRKKQDNYGIGHNVVIVYWIKHSRGGKRKRKVMYLVSIEKGFRVLFHNK